jgi:hypothetical protein
MFDPNKMYYYTIRAVFNNITFRELDAMEMLQFIFCRVYYSITNMVKLLSEMFNKMF